VRGGFRWVCDHLFVKIHTIMATQGSTPEDALNAPGDMPNTQEDLPDTLEELTDGQCM
jgi:hypothetical protein